MVVLAPGKIVCKFSLDEWSHVAKIRKKKTSPILYKGEGNGELTSPFLSKGEGHCEDISQDDESCDLKI